MKLYPRKSKIEIHSACTFVYTEERGQVSQQVSAAKLISPADWHLPKVNIPLVIATPGLGNNGLTLMPQRG